MVIEQTCPPSTTDENNSLTRTDGANSTSKSNKPPAHRRPFVHQEKMRRAAGERESFCKQRTTQIGREEEEEEDEEEKTVTMSRERKRTGEWMKKRR
ncbi:hypothetical protein ABVT39_018288 [Epinephelus coioides]